MTDYDLGKAKGRIVIQHDERGYRRAEGANDDLHDSAVRVAEGYGEAEKAQKEFEQQARRTERAEDALSKANSELEKMTNRLSEAQAKVNRLIAEGRAQTQEYSRAVEEATKAENRRNEALNEAREAERLLQREVQRRVDAEQKASQAAERAQRENLRRLDELERAQRRVCQDGSRRIEIDIDNRRAMRNLGDVHRELRAIRAISRGAIIGAAGFQAVGALGGALGVAGAGLVGIGSQGILGAGAAIADMAGALGVIPGVIGAAVTAMGTLKIATSRVGEAMDKLGTEDFAESLKGLAPGAQGFLIQLNSLIPRFKEFQKGLEESFFGPLQKIPVKMANVFEPILKGPMNQIASIFGATGRGLAEWLMEPSQQKEIERFLSNTVAGLQSASQAAQPFAQAIMDIMSVSGQFLPQIGAEVAELAREFANFIRTSRENGELFSWIKDGIEQVKLFGSGLKNFFMGFVYIGRVAQEYGAGFISIFKQMSDTFLAWTQSVEGQDSLHQFFQTTSAAVKQLMPLLGVLGNLLVGTLGGGLAKLGEQIAPGLMFFFRTMDAALHDFIQILIDSAPAINGFLSGLAVIFGDIIQQIGPHLPEFLKQMTDAIYKLGLAIGPIAASVIRGLTKIAESFNQNWENWLTPMLKAIKAALEGDWTELDIQLGKMGRFIMERIAVFMRESKGVIIPVGIEIFKEFVDKLLKELPPILQPLQDILRDSGEKIVKEFAKGMLRGIPLVGPIAEKLVSAIDEFLPRSPAKKGPFSGSGWTYIRGQKLSKDFARGIQDQSGEATIAGGTLAKSASEGVDRYGKLTGFVEDMLELSGLGQKLLSFLGQISDAVFQAVKVFTTNPLTGESILPKRWARSASDDELRRRREDRAFSEMTSQRSHGKASADQIMTSRGPAPQSIGSGAQGIADYIYQKALSEGYSRQQAEYFIIQAVGESGLNPKANGGNQDGTGDVGGIFQFTPGTWGNRPGSMWNAKDNIDQYFELARERGLTPENFLDPTQLGTQVSIGGPWHPQNAAKGHLDTAKQNAKRYIDNLSQVIAATTENTLKDLDPNNAERTGPLVQTSAGNNATDLSSKPSVVTLTRESITELAKSFGLQVTSDDRPGDPGYHGRGMALDLSNGTGNTPEQRAFAEYMAKHFGAQLKELIYDAPGWAGNIKDGKNVGAFGEFYTMGQAGRHDNHVHIAFQPGTKVEAPGLTESIRSQFLNAAGISEEKFAEYTPEEQKAALDTIANNTNKTASGQDELINALRGGDAQLDSMLRLYESGGATDQDVSSILGMLDTRIAEQNSIDTAQSRATANALSSLQSDIATERGFSAGQNPIDMASGIASGAMGVVGDVFKIIDGSLKSIGSAAAISDTLVRGIENTEDIMNIIDHIQSFVELATTIAQTVTDGLSLAGTIAGAAGSGDSSGAASGAATGLQAAAAISGIVTSVISSINAAIDLGQEVYRIGTKYLGRALSFLVGGGQGSLMGDIKFLLDETNGVLRTWSGDNPDDKRAFNIPWWLQGDQDREEQSGKIRDINMYIGPGTDPNEAMASAMWAVRTDQNGVFTGAGASDY